MLTIDGSRLEGGGQIVRSAVALSALTGTDITLQRIRAGRSTPGLRHQHVAAISAVGAACNATCRGLAPGSSTLVFLPGTPEYRDLQIDIGTAGSIPLVLQAWLPVALSAGGRLTVTGGTEVMKSPTIDYFDRVFCDLLRFHGARITISIDRRGYFPEGGGSVTVSVEPTSIAPIDIPPRQATPFAICSCSSNLPDHVASRQADAAKQVLERETGHNFEVFLDRRQGPSTGSSVTAWAGWKGAVALGRRGLPAEKVGRSAARTLCGDLDREGEVDIHLADQLLIFLWRYGGSFAAWGDSLHAATMCWLLGLFGDEIGVSGAQVKRYSA